MFVFQWTPEGDLAFICKSGVEIKNKQSWTQCLGFEDAVDHFHMGLWWVPDLHFFELMTITWQTESHWGWGWGPSPPLSFARWQQFEIHWKLSKLHLPLFYFMFHLLGNMPPSERNCCFKRWTCPQWLVLRTHCTTSLRTVPSRLTN